MASITIRNLDEDIKKLLRVRAAEHSHSMEEEVRLILRDAVCQKTKSQNLADVAEFYFGQTNGVDLELPTRVVGREPPCFE